MPRWPLLGFAPLHSAPLHSTPLQKKGMSPTIKPSSCIDLVLEKTKDKIAGTVCRWVSFGPPSPLLLF